MHTPIGVFTAVYWAQKIARNNNSVNFEFMSDQSFIETPAGRHLKSRVDAVMAIYKEHGHVNRTLISEKLELTKLQSSQLLREFLSAHAPVLEWDHIHQSYKAHKQFRVH